MSSYAVCFCGRALTSKLGFGGGLVREGLMINRGAEF